MIWIITHHYLWNTTEIMAPERKHEVSAENIARLLEAYFEETRTKFWGLGSTTFCQQAQKGGTEPDKSYCIVEEKEFPDLAIEVVVTSGGIDKLEIYKRLGVKEVWYFKENQFAV
ncbi:MAG: Uma2 family endonuclease [Cyanothece sp. SIO1E1]|nr:Uma2 family endonuclease [Cyanothece sp. SIO1E1]